MKLTLISVSELKTPADMRTKIFWDSLQPGFGVRVSSAGRKSYLLDYKLESGKQRRITIGRSTEITPKQARKKARQLLYKLSVGIDPLAGK